MNSPSNISEPGAGYERLKLRLQAAPRSWLVTGVAGFIGSHLLETLLKLGQRVTGLDNFATGFKRNFSEVKQACDAGAWKHFQFMEGSIGDPATCRQACQGVDFILHQAALGSVPRSIKDPRAVHEANVNGTLNIFLAARDAGIKRVVYASSSSVYGDHPGLPKVESVIGHPLSPYAASKRIGEVYADAFSLAYGLETIGLRYFNVFGPRQDPAGPYAAVIPLWISKLLRREAVFINGDGSSSRDFCYVQNVVQANLLAATSSLPGVVRENLNVACGENTTLNELFALLKQLLGQQDAQVRDAQPQFRDFRPGDVKHSLADINKARKLLHYHPTHNLRAGLAESLGWYRTRAADGMGAASAGKT